MIIVCDIPKVGRIDLFSKEYFGIQKIMEGIIFEKTNNHHIG